MSLTTTSLDGETGDQRLGLLGLRPERYERGVAGLESDERFEQLAAARGHRSGSLVATLGRDGESREQAGQRADGQPVRLEALRPGRGVKEPSGSYAAWARKSRPRNAEALRVGDDERARRIGPAQPLLP